MNAELRKIRDRKKSCNSFVFCGPTNTKKVESKKNKLTCRIERRLDRELLPLRREKNETEEEDGEDDGRRMIPEETVEKKN